MKGAQAGFTLLELLVVMSLLALTMVAVGSALRTIAMTETRVDERLARSDQMRSIHGLLTGILGRAEELKIDNSTTKGGRKVHFLATSDSIEWVGVMPARPGAGGRYFFRLAIEEISGSNALVLRYIPWQPQPGFPDWNLCDQNVLMMGLEFFQIEAQGLPFEIQTATAGWPRGWQLGWPVGDAIPQRMRFTLGDKKGPWPPLVVAIAPTLQSQPGDRGFVIGGTVR